MAMALVGWFSQNWRGHRTPGQMIERCRYPEIVSHAGSEIHVGILTGVRVCFG
jgi:hypothetical protein